MTLDATEVFTPNDFPQYTYIERKTENLEQQLRDTLATPNLITSLAGPSKSGKTMLVRHVVADERIIRISGIEVILPGSLWRLILENSNVPDSATEETTEEESEESGGHGSGTLGAMGTNVTAGLTSKSASARKHVSSQTYERGGLGHVEDTLAGQEFVVFIDDFHYIERQLQSTVAREIKVASERGIRFIVASVPHRSGDVVRSNPELIGRVRGIDITFWSVDELKAIAVRGYGRLNINIDDATATAMAEEACGSPQLMQRICLDACFHAGFKEAAQGIRQLPINESFLRETFEQSALTTDHGLLVGAMHQGPRIRGKPRSVFEFTDGSRGDAYRAVLLAIASSPPTLSLSYAEVIKRVQSNCKGASPTSSSVTEACRQIARIARERQPDQRTIEWDDNTLDVVDPYFLFYLRSSRKLGQLGRAATAV